MEYVKYFACQKFFLKQNSLKECLLKKMTRIKNRIPKY